MRIVSLLPSATEIVSLLGLDDALVGVSADSDWPPQLVARLPVLNTVSIDPAAMTSREIDAAATASGHQGASLYHVDADLLRTLKPDLVLTQEICEVCAVSRRDVALAAQTLGYEPWVLSLSPVTIEQVFEDIELVARSSGEAGRSAGVVSSLRNRLDVVRQRVAGLPRARVFCMEWLDPPYTAGHWVPEMVDIAGGRDDLGTPAGPSRQIAWQEIVDYAPDVIVLMPCSLELDRVAAEFSLLTALPGWNDVPAVKDRRVFAGNTQLFSRSGPRLVDGVEVLARILHGEAVADLAALPGGHALRVSPNGAQLEPFQ